MFHLEFTVDRVRATIVYCFMVRNRQTVIGGHVLVGRYPGTLQESASLREKRKLVDYIKLGFIYFFNFVVALPL